MAQAQNTGKWSDEDEYWRAHYRNRPYAGAREYDYYQPGYRYGYEAAGRYQNRDWTDVEADLSRDWDSYEHRGTSTWEEVKDAVRDAWDRLVGNRPADTR